MLPVKIFDTQHEPANNLTKRKHGNAASSNISTDTHKIIPIASPITDGETPIPMAGRQREIFEEAVMRSITGNINRDYAGNPTSSDPNAITVIPNKVSTTLYFRDDRIPFFTLYLCGIVLLYLYTMSCGIAGMVGMFALVDDFNLQAFLLATSLLGGAFFIATFFAYFRYGHQYKSTSPKHNKAIFEPFATMFLYGLIAWISLFVWTKDYESRFVNTHAPNELNRFYVTFVFYVVAWIASSVSLGGFIVASRNPERKNPDVVVVDDNDNVYGVFNSQDVQILDQYASSRAQDEAIAIDVKTK